mgnify:CR=1 FL=1
MATYVNDLRLKEIATGDESGTWGTSTNTNLELIAEAFSFGTEAITTNADTHTTTIADGSTDPGRSIYLKYTGTLDSACTITIGPNTVSKLWFIENGTSGSQNIIISQGSGANVTIPPGDTKAIYSDGAGSGAAMVDAFASLNVVDLKVEDDLTVTDDATVGGTLGVTGIVTLTDDLIIGDGKTIGSASDVDAMTIASNGQVTFSQTLIGTALDISGDIDVDGTANLDVVDIDGAVDMASTLAVGGVLTADAGVSIDNITIDGTEIDLSSGDLTIDVAGDIILDADGADIKFSDGGTEFADHFLDGNDYKIQTTISNGDFIIVGNDGGSAINAFTLDMSDAGVATFNSSVILKNLLSISSSNTSGFLAASDNVLQFGASSDDPLTIFTNNSERVRIDASGNFLVGASDQAWNTSSGFRVNSPGQAGQFVTITNTSSTATDETLILHRQAAVTAGEAIQFYRAGVAVGSVRVSSGSTSFDTSSDYRLKTNVQTMEDNGLERVKKLRPVTFNWIEDDDGIHEGFIAHEIQEAGWNEGIAGVKDDEQIHQAVDYGRITPLLVKAIQEQQEQIDALQSEINILKGE